MPDHSFNRLGVCTKCGCGQSAAHLPCEPRAQVSARRTWEVEQAKAHLPSSRSAIERTGKSPRRRMSVREASEYARWPYGPWARRIAATCLVLAGLGPLSQDGLDDAVDLLNAAGTVAFTYVILIYIPRFLWAVCRGQDAIGELKEAVVEPEQDDFRAEVKKTGAKLGWWWPKTGLGQVLFVIWAGLTLPTASVFAWGKTDLSFPSLVVALLLFVYPAAWLAEWLFNKITDFLP